MASMDGTCMPVVRDRGGDESLSYRDCKREISPAKTPKRWLNNDRPKAGTCILQGSMHPKPSITTGSTGRSEQRRGT